MGIHATPYTVTTALLIAFAVFVIYVRTKTWLDSNVPLFFYVALIAYMHAIGGDVPLWLMFTGFGLTLLLRFEFMNSIFINVVKTLEICILAIIVYLSLKMIL